MDIELSSFNRIVDKGGNAMNQNSTLADVLKVAKHIDIELLSETEEQARNKILQFTDFGTCIKKEIHDDKWFQINANDGVNVFSYYKK